MADAGAIDEVPRIDAAEVAQIDRVADFAAVGKARDESLGLPLHGVEDGGVVILQRKENQARSPKVRRESIFAERRRPKYKDPQSRSMR